MDEIISTNDFIKTKTTEAQKKATLKWMAKHRDKVCEYSRNNYYKNIESNPDFRKKKSENVMKNYYLRKQRKLEELQNLNPNQNIGIKKRGRPRKYENNNILSI